MVIYCQFWVTLGVTLSFYGSRISHVLLCAVVAAEQDLVVQIFVLVKTSMYAQMNRQLCFENVCM